MEVLVISKLVTNNDREKPEYRLSVKVPIARSQEHLTDLKIHFSKTIICESNFKDDLLKEWFIVFKRKIPAVKAFQKASNLSFVNSIRLVLQNQAGEELQTIAESKK